MKKKKTLLELGRVPTLEELRAFFCENDFSAAAYMDMDYDKLDAGTVETLEHIKGLMDEQWEPLSRQMGLKADSTNYGKDNPLIAMRDSMANLVAGGVLKLLTEHPERAADILVHFADDPNIEQNADSFLHNAVEMTMQTMSYAETAEIVRELPAYEDFDHSRFQNYRGMDFDRKWNHSRAKAKIESLNALQERDDGEGDYPVPDFSADVEGEALAGILAKDFWDSITEEDRTLLRLKMAGKTQQEIADILGYQTQGAVSKRLARMKDLFEKCG
ncbi:MAG: hypothetical protein H6Q60_813 [Oscillospiraceae bacterium]|nr:hypothetical protein [Oscillospiraceae bacterium]